MAVEVDGARPHVELQYGGSYNQPLLHRDGNLFYSNLPSLKEHMENHKKQETIQKKTKIIPKLTSRLLKSPSLMLCSKNRNNI